MRPRFPRPPFLWSESASPAGAARENSAMTRQEAAASVASAGVRRPLAWLLGTFALLGFLRRRREPVPVAADPRAEELRRKLEESRSIVEERDEFEGAEVTVDRAEPGPD